jgi:hypothetical protein
VSDLTTIQVTLSVIVAVLSVIACMLGFLWRALRTAARIRTCIETLCEDVRSIKADVKQLLDRVAKLEGAFTFATETLHRLLTQLYTQQVQTRQQQDLDDPSDEIQREKEKLELLHKLQHTGKLSLDEAYRLRDLLLENAHRESRRGNMSMAVLAGILAFLLSLMIGYAAAGNRREITLHKV